LSVARSLIYGRVPYRSRLVKVPFRPGAYKLVMAPEWLLTRTGALAIGKLASRRGASAERRHVLQCRDQGFYLKPVRCKAAFQPNEVRVLIRYGYPTPNLASHDQINQCFANSGGFLDRSKSI
jgi:hypothetical protein